MSVNEKLSDKDSFGFFVGSLQLPTFHYIDHKTSQEKL